MSITGLVAIGRNEGQRLHRCLQSALDRVDHIVYVDSGSTDGSIEFAESLSIEVVSLDLSIPFTAARARNAGVERLLQINPHLEFIQFVDGDCEIVEEWIERAQQELLAHPDVAAVCGRRREQFPQRSIYNQICDIEWNTPIGEANACGGDSMMRVTAFQQAGGFNPSLIAGEEPELCVRLRQQGWRILRIDAEMTLHDAQMMHFYQWWKRSQRAGHAFAEGRWLHGQSPQQHWVKESRRIWIWGLLLPILSLGAAIPTQGWSFLLLLAYPLSAYRSYRHTLERGCKSKEAALYSLFCTIGKFPEMQGQIQFYLRKILNQKGKLIEYKSAA